MAVAEDPNGFLGRWARRKTAVLQGKPVEDPAPETKAPVPSVAAAPAGTVAQTPAGDSRAAVPASGSAANEPAKTLSLDDVRTLTKDSDFKPFMAGDVGPEVRNAAMKKLFTDPHFNVMDGLDIYIDDYSVSEPIPESMLRQMTSAKFLNLFDEDKEEDKKDDQKGGQKDGVAAPPAGESAYPPDSESVAQSPQSPAALPAGPSGALDPSPIPGSSGFPDTDTSQPVPVPGAEASPQHHAHTDLRLQPDHAAPAPHAGRGTE
ncbi:DUF3306 domain-containing protein [Polaromonas sp. YR568]|uniref:DUF3306 domain-containing protein n=1 Tax=Polaromonas sp. YR568 TaxID=1855301 RepID=UPI0031377DB1